MLNKICRLRQNSKGAALIEYALIAGLIAIVAIGVMTNVGKKINNVFNKIDHSMPTT